MFSQSGCLARHAAFLEAYQFEFTTGFFDFNVPIVIQQVPA